MTAPVTITEVKALLEQKNLAPLKSLGQNFLIDRNFLTKIVKAGELTEQDFVLEIGPGLGGLTHQLVLQAGRVLAVEYDRGLFAVLQQNLAEYQQLELVNQDFLQFELQQIITKYSGYKFKVIANLPYYITSPIIFKLLESRIDWQLMIFLVQKEVALRIAARPGGKDYGALTVMLNFFGSTEIVCTVPKNVFYPAPKIDSAVVKITPRASIDWLIYPYLQQVVQAAFGQRRKTILNTLSKFEAGFGGKQLLKEFLREIGINPEQRGETIDVQQYVIIAKHLKKHTLEGV